MGGATGIAVILTKQADAQTMKSNEQTGETHRELTQMNKQGETMKSNEQIGGMQRNEVKQTDMGIFM